jgi:hypothetical protein
VTACQLATRVTVCPWPEHALILARLSEVERIEVEDGGTTLDTEAIKGSGRGPDRARGRDRLGRRAGGNSHLAGNDVPGYHSRMVTMPDGRRERRPERPVFWRALQILRDGTARAAWWWWTPTGSPGTGGTPGT